MNYIHLTTLAGFLAGSAMAGSIGFRGDGTGVLPADAKPPAEFDGVTGKNLVWKSPLPNFSNGSPICVGKKVFVVTDVGWPANAEGDVPHLLCFDAETGKQLWSRPIDAYDALPKEKAEPLRKERAQLWADYRKANEAAAPATEAASQGRPKVAEPKKSRTLVNEGGILGWHWNLTGMGYTMIPPVSDGQRVFVFTGFRTATAFDLDGNRLWHHFHNDIPANSLYSHQEEEWGNAPMIVEGKLLMHYLDHLFCYDPATGRVLWRTPARAHNRHAMGTPVVLRLPDKSGAKVTCLLTYNGHLIRVADGKLIAKNFGPIGCAALGSDGGDVVVVNFNWSTGSGTGSAEDKAPLLFKELINQNVGLRFRLTDTGAVADVLWKEGKTGPEIFGYPLALGDRFVTAAGHVAELLTGKVLGTPPKKGRLWHNGSILAGGRVYGLPSMSFKGTADAVIGCTVTKLDGTSLATPVVCPVETLTWQPADDTKRAQRLALTGSTALGPNYRWHESYSAPFASGNRLFIRTFDHLYCFGDKSQPFVASKDFDLAR